MKATADHIRKLIGDGLLEDGLQAALAYLRDKNPGMYNECLQHQGRLNECERKLRLGVLGMDEAEKTRAMVRYSLVEVVAKEIEGSSQNPFSNLTTPPKQEIFHVNLGSAAQAPVPQYVPPAQQDSAEQDLEKASAVIEELFSVLARYDVGMAARQAMSLLHPSLLQDGQMRPHFKQNNFNAAHQRYRAYKVPVEITQCKSTNRRAIGTFGNRDEGEEFVYTLAKHQEQGGMPGMVRLFFSKNQDRPMITVISL